MAVTVVYAANTVLDTIPSLPLNGEMVDSAHSGDFSILFFSVALLAGTTSSQSPLVHFWFLSLSMGFFVCQGNTLKPSTPLYISRALDVPHLRFSGHLG